MSRDPTDIEGEEAAQVAGRKVRENAAATAEDDLRWLLSSDRGRRVIWQILELTHLFQPSYAPGDTEMTFVREGERNIGLKLQADLARADKPAFAKMLQEHYNP